MLTKIFVLLVVLSTVDSYTRVRINNYCDWQLTIVERDEIKSQLCKLPVGQSCYKDYSLVDGGRVYENDWYENGTAVVIGFNHESLDGFYIDLMYGFDLPVNITSNKGKSLVCLDEDCPDDMSKISGKIETVSIDGIFDINYCPSKSGLFGGKTLELVETVHNPMMIKSMRSGRAILRKPVNPLS